MRKAKNNRICVICEGYEEQEYFETLKSKAIFSNIYDFVTINAKSNNTIIARYKEKYQSDSYSLVLIFCDTDKGPSQKYLKIKEEINEFHGEDVADDIVIFGNPCTMQIILSHFGEVRLKSQSKVTNSKVIEELTGIQHYKAAEQQRKELFAKIKQENYITMKQNISKLSSNDNDLSSTNFLKFIEWFENDDAAWIEEINSKL